MQSSVSQQLERSRPLDNLQKLQYGSNPVSESGTDLLSMEEVHARAGKVEAARTARKRKGTYKVELGISPGPSERTKFSDSDHENDYVRAVSV